MCIRDSIHCVRKKVTPKPRTTKMSNLNESVWNFIHLGLICDKLIKRSLNFVKNIIFSGVINCWISTAKYLLSTKRRWESNVRLDSLSGESGGNQRTNRDRSPRRRTCADCWSRSCSYSVALFTVASCGLRRRLPTAAAAQCTAAAAVVTSVVAHDSAHFGLQP